MKNMKEKREGKYSVFLTWTKLLFLMVLPPEMPLCLLHLGKSYHPFKAVQQTPVDRINDGKMCKPQVFRKHPRFVRKGRRVWVYICWQESRTGWYKNTFHLGFRYV